MREPSPDALGNPFLRYVLATRPAFLLTTLTGCLLGLATAHHQAVAADLSLVVLTLVLALLAHAGTNVLNDYFDALNGTDDCNEDRLYPFTGGSRFIQNGVLTRSETAVFGYALFGIVIAGGLYLASRAGPGLLLIGAAGLFVGWAYSASPLRLNSRGLGEPCVVLGTLLVVVGADYVLRRTWEALPWVAGLSFALLVANVLYINQFPDRRADEAAGKRHWVVCLGVRRARWGYGAIALLAAGGVLAGWQAGALPDLALFALMPLALSAWGGAWLWRHAHEPRLLVPAIRATIAAALAHGMLLAAILAMTGRQG